MRIERLPLRKLSNTRDLGSMPAFNGKTIKYKRLIRSGKLYKLPKSTVKKLEALPVKKVIDLRIKTELDSHPDTRIDGAEYIWLPILCTATPGITYERSMRIVMQNEGKRIKKEFGNADNYMIEMYKRILFNEDSKEYLRKVLKVIIDNEEGAVLWHCAGGKDRAGIVSMLVESLLGVGEDDILEDYCASNVFQRRHNIFNKLGLWIAPVRHSLRKILFAMMNAKIKYLEATIAYVNEQYGSVINYCKRELGITDEDIEKMRDKYLEVPQY